MAEGNASEGLTKPRQALGDITNLLGKRESYEIEKVGVKGSSFSNEDSSKRMRVSSPSQAEIHSPKTKVTLDIPNTTEEKMNASVNEFGRESAFKISSDVRTGIDNDTLPNVNLITVENFEGPNMTDHKGKEVMSYIAIEANEIPEIGQSEFGILKGNQSDLRIKEGGEVGQGSSKGSKENVVENIGVNAYDESGDALEAATEMGGYCVDSDSGSDGYESKGSQSDANDSQQVPDGDEQNFVLSKCGSVDCVNFPPGSQESTVVGFDKSMERSGKDKCVCEGTEPTRNCSCSFCTKAGYMYLDLNYQDIKARVSALKKSQKEANILAERIIRSKSIETHGVESFTRSSKLESDLTYHWVSLFQHMAGVMEQESNQLEGRLQPLNDLREKCKIGLESIGAKNSEKH